ncbi:MAG: prepilin-type N-terminal cleavage/methylation domain-containing protein [Phycisphaerales bacterium]|nr:prepilin-type N-terminal cleavage/methylation domain-containing protein [Phycisphaerales bacterium]
MRMKRQGFSLIELLVVIGVVVVLIGLAMPALKYARDSARTAQCLTNAGQLAVAITTFSGQNRNRLPENRTVVGEGEYITWREQLSRDGFYSDSSGRVCPSHKNPGSEFGYSEGGMLCVGDQVSSYALNGHVLWRGGITDDNAKISDTVIRRPSHTILVAETNRGFANLRVSNPYIANYYGDDPGPYGYWHRGDAVYSFQDGHAEVISLLDTGNPDCRWHNGRDLTDDPYVPQGNDEIRPHDHPDWEYLVPEVYLP